MTAGSETPPPSSAAPGLLARVKACALALVKNYEDSNGVGPDDYWPHPMAHAMADGKYLSALAELRRANIIGDNLFQRAAAAAIKRLEAAAVPGYGGGIAWGLNFSYNQAPADEAYLITTALVVRGLLSLRGLPITDQDHLLANALPSLVAWPQGILENIHVPLYSASTPRPIYNAAAQAIVAMTEAGLDVTQASADFMAVLREKRVEGCGWTYEPGSSRADILHCCYVLEFCQARISAKEAQTWLLQTVSHFGGRNAFIDGFDVLDWDAALQQTKPDTIFFSQSRAFLSLGRPARAWSLGELLCCLSSSATAPVTRALARHVAKEILDRFFDGTEDAHINGETMPPRHGMHLLHGMARLLRAERTANGTTGSFATFTH